MDVNGSNKIRLTHNSATNWARRGIRMDNGLIFFEQHGRLARGPTDLRTQL